MAAFQLRSVRSRQSAIGPIPVAEHQLQLPILNQYLDGGHML